MYRLLFLSLALMFFLLPLSACSNQTNTADQPGGVGAEQTENTLPEGLIRLSLPDGICADLVQQMTGMADSLQVNPLDAEQDAAALLTDGTADLVLLSPKRAATLYNSGTAVQVVAVVDPGKYGADSMVCLVSTAAYLADNRELIQRFLTAYQETASASKQENALCVTGWDMLDMVQKELEAQYMLSSTLPPEGDFGIPPGGFYYIP